MTRRRMITGSALAVGGTTTLLARAEQIGNGAAMERAEELIQRQVDAGVLDAAVLHVREGDEAHERAFGKGVTPDSIFLLASLTKTMTAAAVMVLADQGKLRLADPVRRFIPEFSEGSRGRVTVMQLLNHTSGLPDQVPENAALRSRHATLAEFVRAAVRTPLLFAPGTRYHYQSMGSLLAAEIVERISNEPLPIFLEREVFSRLGMKRTVMGLGGFGLNDVVMNQTEHGAPESGAGNADAKSWDWNSAYWRRLGAPWGGGHGTARDFATFLHSFLRPDGAVLRRETALSMIQDQTGDLKAGRGIGFDLRHETFGKGCSPETFGHSGSTGNLAWADPASGRIVVILSSLPGSVSGPLFLRPVSDILSNHTA